MQTCGERLLESHEQIPGPELSAVCMSRQLQIKARIRRRGRRARLMCEQYFHGRIQGSTRERSNGIATLRGIEVMGTKVRHSRENQRCPSVPHDHMLIQ